MFNDDGLLERGDVVRVAGRGATTLEHALGQLHLPPSAGSPDRTPRQPPPHVVGQRWYYNCWEGGGRRHHARARAGPAATARGGPTLVLQLLGGRKSDRVQKPMGADPGVLKSTTGGSGGRTDTLSTALHTTATEEGPSTPRKGVWLGTARQKTVLEMMDKSQTPTSYA
jgi:hypothetical protein